MHLEHFRARFEKLSKERDFIYFLAEKAIEQEVAEIESKLKISFPAQVKLFYESFNGLKVNFPKLEIFPVENLKFLSKNRLNFAVIDENHRLFFDTSYYNEANQWNIVADDDFLVTLTMASFWSNKIWAWIEKERKIWKEEFEID